MSVVSDGRPGRVLRIGIDARELQGRPTGVGRYLRSLLRRFVVNTPHQFVIYNAAPVALPVASQAIESRVLPGGHPFVWEQRTLQRALALDRIDVLLSPAYSCPLFTPVPRVTAIHDLSFFARPEEFGALHGLRRRLMARASARASRALLACSEFTKAEMGRHLGPEAARKTEVVRLGPDDDLPKGPARSPGRRELGLAEDAVYVITVGTVLRRRNVSMLLRAFAALRKTNPKVRLGIIGENRTHPFEDIAGLARELGCESDIRIAGFVTDEEIARHYAAADLAVFLSEYEGFGLPALEAMSRGVPTVVANRGSLSEMFSSGALVVEPRDEDVTGALRSVIDDSTFAAELRRRGSETAAQFSWEKAARETLAVLERSAL
jgi:glycosyltransferase involved in cell wall biosynthesis